ncbi:MAG: hypothetical protein QM673_01895 [Gordonia sp. (in: high G+C Gram-positive bacteria)]
MDIVESIVKVFAIGLVLGAGLPALFAIGMALESRGAGEAGPNGTTVGANPALRAFGYVLFAVVAVAIVIGLLWITRQTLSYYFDLKIFPSWAYSK